MDHQPSFCRLCLNGCAISVEMDGRRPVSVTGVKDNPVYKGFTCVKGRSQARLLAHPGRLRRSLKRVGDEHVPIPVEQAMDEVAARLSTIIAEDGPRAVAGYLGTQFAAAVTTMPLFAGFMGAIKTPMVFSPATIDKPGKKIALAFHGEWMAPAVEFDDPEVILLIGSNPLVTFTGFPYGNPGRWLNDLLKRGTKLIVIDPRRSDVARRAHLHLQPPPGHDVAILAAMTRVILEEELWDRKFADEFISGVEALREAVLPFDPEAVAARADIDAADLILAARTIAGTRRGYINAGTGPNMSGSGSLIEYLALNLHSLCGYWLRAGDNIRHPGVLAAPKVMKAQVSPPKPAYGFGERMRTRGLGMSAAGMPTGALADEILLPGKGRVRALISCAGNPAGAWPDQNKTVDAMRALDLLVQMDPWMTATSRLADYVIAPRMWLEVPGHTQVLDWLTRFGTGYGQSEPYGQYSAAIADPPEDSDLIEEWEFFYGLAQRMGLQLSISPQIGPEMPPFALDMVNKPTTEDLLERLAAGSRIPLEEVKKHPYGAIFPGEPQSVVAKDLDATARFDVAADDMLADLAATADSYLGATYVPDSGFRLVVRRMMHVYNTSFVGALPDSARAYNPAFMNPEDLAALGLVEGDVIEVSSDRSAIIGIVHPDDTLRRGLVSMSFGFGALPGSDADYKRIGSNTTRLLSDDRIYDRYSGQPLMTNIRVDVRRSSLPSDQAQEIDPLAEAPVEFGRE